MKPLVVAVVSLAVPLAGCNMPRSTLHPPGASHMPRPNTFSATSAQEGAQPGAVSHTSRQTVKQTTAAEERWILRAYQARKNLEEWSKIPAPSPAERVRSQIEFAYMQHLPDSEHSGLVVDKIGDTEVRSLFLYESDEKHDQPFMISWYDSKEATGVESGCRIVHLPESWTLYAHGNNLLTVHAGEDALQRPLAIVTFQTDNPFATRVTDPDWVKLEEQWTQRALVGLNRVEALQKKGRATLTPREKVELLVETAYAAHIPGEDEAALYNLVVKRDGDWEFRKIVINADESGHASPLVLAWMYRDSQLVGFRTESVPANWQVSQIENRVTVSTGVSAGEGGESQQPGTLVFDRDNPFDVQITD